MRLPRFLSAALVHSRTRTRFLAQGREIQRFHLPRTIPCGCHAKRRPATQQVTPFPTPATRNARRAREPPRLSREISRAAPPMATIPHTCHAKRTLSNIKMHDSSTAQRRPNRPRASGVPRLPRDTHVHVLLHARIIHHSARLPRETSTHTHAATRSRHAELQRHAQANMPADVRGRPAHTPRTRPRPPDSHLETRTLRYAFALATAPRLTLGPVRWVPPND